MQQQEVVTAFSVIPAVDLLGDEAVRLSQGDYGAVTVREPDPLALVRRFAAAGASMIHVVDLDGARSGRLRPELVARLAEAALPARLQASGGVRTTADALALVEAGATRVVIGTAAFEREGALDRFAAALGERLVVAVDVRGDRVAARGWTSPTSLSVERAVSTCVDAGVSRLLCTAIERDGTLQGPDLRLLSSVVDWSSLPVLAAGGVRSEEDLASIASLGCEGAIVGRALLEGNVTLGVLRSGDSL